MATASPVRLSTLQPQGIVAQPPLVAAQQPVVVAQQPILAQPAVYQAAAPVSYGYSTTGKDIVMWIWYILVTFFVIIGIFYFLQVSMVTDTLPNGDVVINRQKLFLWGLFWTLIFWLVMWIILKWGMACVGK